MTPEVIESASQILGKHLLLFSVIAQTDLLALALKYPENPREMFENAILKVLEGENPQRGSFEGRGALIPDASTSASSAPEGERDIGFAWC